MPHDQGEQTRWFAQEVQPHEPALRAFVFSRFPTVSDVDDLIQDTFNRVLHARRKGPITSPRGLLFTVARNLALDAVRRQRVIAFEPIPENASSSVFMDATDVAETVNKQQELELLARAIQSLPDRCRQVMTLRAVYGMPQRDIASRLAISENTVEKQIKKGLRRCGDFLAAHGLT